MLSNRDQRQLFFFMSGIDFHTSVAHKQKPSALLCVMSNVHAWGLQLCIARQYIQQTNIEKISSEFFVLHTNLLYDVEWKKNACVARKHFLSYRRTCIFHTAISVCFCCFFGSFLLLIAFSNNAIQNRIHTTYTQYLNRENPIGNR